jgi:hypothetical protein
LGRDKLRNRPLAAFKILRKLALGVRISPRAITLALGYTNPLPLFNICNTARILARTPIKVAELAQHALHTGR